MKYIQDQEKRFMTSLESNEERLNSAKNAAPNLPKFSGKSAPKIFTPIIAYTYAKNHQQTESPKNTRNCLYNSFYNNSQLCLIFLYCYKTKHNVFPNY